MVVALAERDTTGMSDKVDRARMARAARDAVRHVEKLLLEMAAGPGEGTVVIEMLGSRGQIRVKPTPFYVHDGDG